MGLIYYGVCGEGRGHATRAKTVVDHLCRHHDVVLFTSGQALEIFASTGRSYSDEANRKNRAGTLHVREIDGLRWKYGKNGTVAYAKSVVSAVPYLASLPKRVRSLAKEIGERQVDLVLSDFEPLCARAAQRAGVPLWSLDHQHYLTVCELGPLNLLDRLKVASLSAGVRLHHRPPDRMLVSGFHFPGRRPGCEHAELVGVLLRDAVLKAKVASTSSMQRGTSFRSLHLVVYLRRSSPRFFLPLLKSLANKGVTVHVYGMGERKSEGTLHFRAVHPEVFVEDLARSDALICTAGNQLVGEALYLGKPVFAIPEPRNFEQRLNGRFLNMSGAGLSVLYQDLNEELLVEFLENLGGYRAAIQKLDVCGNKKVFALLDEFFQDPSSNTKSSSTKAPPLTLVG